MGHIKTAISLDEPVFKEAEKLAHEMKISRSELFSRAVEAYIRRRENRRIKEKMDQIYSQATAEDEASLKFARRAARKILKDVEWK